MCGIVGIFYREQPTAESDVRRVQAVLKQTAYRGPDGSGIWRDRRAVLGHNRLSIIDLSDAGAQPFEDPQRGLSLTFNGEIYNFKEVRAQLLAAGYTFKSQTDTEVILYAYDHFGDSFLSHLRGMFAFCLYDQKKRRVILARDRIGEKPLFFHWDANRFLFSSEIKSFHAFHGLPLEIDLESLRSYFVLQYIPGPHTIYTNIQELAPGTWIEIDLDSWRWSEKTYWSVFDQLTPAPGSAGQVDELLGQSIRYQLVGDVKIGVLLSGGVDSSLISWHVKNSGANVTAFTARFDRSELDESPYAQEVARSLGMDLVVINGGSLTPDIFDKVIFHADEPLGDPACIPTYLLAQELSRYVSVVLSGEGADEIFMGYDHYRHELTWQRLRLLAQAVRHFPGAAALLDAACAARPQNIYLARLNKLFYARHDLGSSRWTSIFADKATAPLFSPQVGPLPERFAYLAELEGTTARLRRITENGPAALLADMRYWLPDDLLAKVDRMSMAHSVEARTPFLDPDVVRCALQLPLPEKIHQKTGKRILRELVAAKFPAETSRPLAWRKKHGFEPPVADWLRGPLRGVLADRLSAPALAQSGLFDPGAVRGLLEQFRQSSGRTPALRRLWLLLAFQSWHAWHSQKFGFDGGRPE